MNSATDDGILRQAILQPGARADTGRNERGSVLIFTRHYAPEPTGSAPVVQLIAEWLSEQGYATRVVTSRPSYPENRITAGYEAGQHDAATENGVAVTRWPTSVAAGSGLLARVVPETRFMLQMLKARASGSMPRSPMLISFCPSVLTVLGALVFKARGGRHLAVVHDIQSGLGSALGSRAVRLVMKLLRLVERFAFNRVDAIIVLSDSMAAALRNAGVRTAITVLPPQVDCRVIRPMPRAAGGQPTLLYSGNLGRKQGLLQLLDMAAILLTRAPDVALVIRGEGPMRSALAARISADRLTNVTLMPLVARDAIAAALAAADVHLVPQLAEGSDFAVPSKAFAIMAAGRPFVTTATPDSTVGLLARRTNAFVCTPPGNAAALADTVLQLLADPQLRERMGTNGRRFVEATADTPVVMNQIAQLLEEQFA